MSQGSTGRSNTSTSTRVWHPPRWRRSARMCSSATATCSALARIIGWPSASAAASVAPPATIGLARQLQLPFAEQDLDLYDAYTADECFLTSTSLCICGVRSLNSRKFGADQVPGPITQRLIEAYAEMVGCDFVAQYLARLD